MIKYCIFVSLGFAALENILYVVNFGTGVSIGRAIFAIPGHTTFGVFMGYYLSRAKHCKLKGNWFGKFFFMLFKEPNQKEIKCSKTSLLDSFYEFVTNKTTTLIAYGFYIAFFNSAQHHF